MINIYADQWSMQNINDIYMLLGAVHLLNALMYTIVTLDDHEWNDLFVIPDYLNIIGAGLYMWSATMYQDEYALDGDRDGYKFGQYNEYYYLIRRIELAASIIEVFASIGWVLAWYASYCSTYEPENEFIQRFCQKPSRPTTNFDIDKAAVSKEDITPFEPPVPNAVGWTLQDPDLWANVTIIVASVIYLTYNCQLLTSNDYANNILYRYGDILYFINSIFYVLAAVRDLGAFTWVPELQWLYFVQPRRSSVEHYKAINIEESSHSDLECKS